MATTTITTTSSTSTTTTRTKTLKLTSKIISLTTIMILLLFLQSQFVVSKDIEDVEEEEVEEYVLDNPNPNLFPTRSRFLASNYYKIKKGLRCDPNGLNICNGVSANNGTSLLHCCKKHCRNVLGDMNNCGECGIKCRFGQRCCHGVCTDVAYNEDHCAKCDKKCPSGVSCNFGVCGYA